MHEHEMEHGSHGRWSGAGRVIAMVIGGTIVTVLLGILLGFVVMHLWNWLMPLMFGFKVITFWQAVGIFVLAKLIFGCSWHGSHHNKWHNKAWKKHRHGFSDNWAPDGDYANWKYYEEYWQAEGKTAYEAYLKRIKNPENK